MTDDLPRPTRVLLARLEDQRGFPAVAAHMAEINRLADRKETSASQLANAVCRDVALTARLLRLVNSAWYLRLPEPVATITRAVVLLGFERVRAIAANLLLFDHLQQGARRGPLADHALQALTTSLIARALSGDAESVEAGEAGLCAMFHRLGDLMLLTLPDVAEALGPAPSEAAQVALIGITVSELGQTVARRWGFPSLIVDSMRPVPPGPAWPPHDRVSWLRTTSAFAHDLAAALGDDDPGAADPVLGRFGAALGLDAPRTAKLLRAIGREVAEHASVLGAVSGEPDGFAARVLGRVAPTDGAPLTPLDADRAQRAFLNQGLDEVAAAVEANDDLNLVLGAVVETAFRGLGFDRVLLCVLDRPSHTLRARHGFGPGVEALLDGFVIMLADAHDPFARAALAGEDLIQDAPGSPAALRRLPDWYRPFAGPGFVAFPMRLNGVPVGLLYADVAGPLPRGRLVHLRRLRDLAVVAIDRRRRG